VGRMICGEWSVNAMITADRHKQNQADDRRPCCIQETLPTCPRYGADGASAPFPYFGGGCPYLSSDNRLTRLQRLTRYFLLRRCDHSPIRIHERERVRVPIEDRHLRRPRALSWLSWPWGLREDCPTTSRGPRDRCSTTSISHRFEPGSRRTPCRLPRKAHRAGRV